MAKMISEIKQGHNDVIELLTPKERQNILCTLRGSDNQSDIFVCEQIRFYNITGRLMTR